MEKLVFINDSDGKFFGSYTNSIWNRFHYSGWVGFWGRLNPPLLERENKVTWEGIKWQGYRLRVIALQTTIPQVLEASTFSCHVSLKMALIQDTNYKEGVVNLLFDTISSTFGAHDNLSCTWHTINNRNRNHCVSARKLIKKTLTIYSLTFDEPFRLMRRSVKWRQWINTSCEYQSLVTICLAMPCDLKRGIEC